MRHWDPWSGTRGERGSARLAPPRPALALLAAVAVVVGGCSAEAGGPAGPPARAAALDVEAPDGMVGVPGGVTTIGLRDDERGGMPHERPAFRAEVAPFLTDRSPVTVARFRRFVQATGFVTEAEGFGDGAVMDPSTGQWTLVPDASWRTPFGPDRDAAPDDHPVTQVSHTDATAFCAWDGGRLLTEVEWEHAARGADDDRSPYAWGDALDDGGTVRANTWTGTFPAGDTGADGFAGGTSPVGHFGETPLGLTDLGGNVWEWTASWYRPVPRDRRVHADRPERARPARGVVPVPPVVLPRLPHQRAGPRHPGVVVRTRRLPLRPRPMTRVLLLAALAAVVGRAEAQPDTLTVVTLNIWHDRGDWPARLDLIDRQLAALRPDVVMLQEVLQKEGLPNQAQAIADRLGMAHVHFVSTDSAGAVHRYGNAVLSTRPFAETGEIRLPPLDAYRTAASVQIDVGGRTVRLVTTHLHHPETAEGAGVRAMEIAHLLDWIGATGDAPVVLGGDFNARPESPEIGMMRGWRDLGGAGVTFGHQEDTPRRRIDYLFDARHDGLVPLAAGVALDRPDATGQYPSDHFAVYARFLLP